MSRLIFPPTAFSLDPSRKGSGGRKRDAKHLAFVRTLPCLVTGRYGAIEAAHLRGPSAAHGKGFTPMQSKPDDCWTVPLSSAQHRRQHTMNEAAFWAEVGIDPFAVAVELYANSGDLEACVMAMDRLRGARPPWAR